jgi:hypothetical protein
VPYVTDQQIDSLRENLIGQRFAANIAKLPELLRTAIEREAEED